MGAVISYNNSNIATASTGEAILLNTEKKYCTDDITVTYTDTFAKDLAYKSYPIGDIYIEADANFPMYAVIGWHANSLTVDMKTYSFTTAYSDAYTFGYNCISKYHIIHNSSTRLGRYFFVGNNNLPFVVVMVGTSTSNCLDSTFRSNTALTCLDWSLTGSLGSACFMSDSSFTTLILRSESIIAVDDTNIFSGTPFADSKKGGTIYIPKTLYDHLGDGTEYDYTAATNWSTISNSGKVVWEQIEGSQYENYYADGTPVSTGGGS